MRSTKDVFEIVNAVRSRSKTGTYHGFLEPLPRKTVILEKKLDFTRNSIHSLSQVFQSLKATEAQPTRSGSQDKLFQTVPNEKKQDTLILTEQHEDTIKKLRKLEVLAQSDKETIDLQQRKLNALRLELGLLKAK